MDNLFDNLTDSVWGLIFLIVGGSAVVIGLIWLAIIAWEAIDTSGVPQADYIGIVLQRGYSPEETHTGTGVGVTSGGQVATVVTSSTSSEKFLLFVREVSGGVVEKLQINQQFYFDVAVGDKIIYTGRYGKISKSFYLDDYKKK